MFGLSIVSTAKLKRLEGLNELWTDLDVIGVMDKKDELEAEWKELQEAKARLEAMDDCDAAIDLSAFEIISIERMDHCTPQERTIVCHIEKDEWGRKQDREWRFFISRAAHNRLVERWQRSKRTAISSCENKINPHDEYKRRAEQRALR